VEKFFLRIAFLTQKYHSNCLFFSICEK
jgi:hypothetical protein